MSSATAYSHLLAHLKQTAALSQAAGLLTWDQETMMPKRGAAQRAEQCAALEAVIHERRTDPRIPDWIAAIDTATLDPAGQVNVAEAARIHRRASRIPGALAEEIARTAARGQGVWAAARAADRFADFAPTLTEMISLRRQEAACLADPGTDPYDALLNDYEPGATAASLTAIFDRLRAGLVDLRARIAETGRDAPRVTGEFDANAQLALARRLADRFGYDWSAGRLDFAVHPFSSGSGGDARITTRVSPADPFNCIYSTIHEAGHAIYEQGIDPANAATPAGEAASMGVHESQSRFLENQLGRSRAFCDWLHPAMVEELGDFGLPSPEALYRAANRVNTGYIRTEADEVHYNLHILMRFDLERDLIGGALAPADLEGEWNARFERDFGRKVDRASNGALQDVHWSVGLFGYFPTYTLGNIYAAELAEAMRKDLPNMDAAVSAGDLTGPMGWLHANIHTHGSLLAPEKLIEAATGHPPTEQPLLAYLNAKFGDLYGI